MTRPYHTMPPAMDDIAETLDDLRAYWRAMTADQRAHQTKMARDGLVAAEITIDDNGDVWFRVFDRSERGI